ncbi:MAG: DUF4271 domain-containing protein [Bacteroidales bacterium]|nr:DUF4271 domain-containing protein [Bacteroidales bacterium]
MVKDNFYIIQSEFLHIGQDTIPQADNVVTPEIKQTSTPVIRKPRPVEIVISKPAQTDTIFKKVSKGYDPDQPSFANIVNKHKDVWDVFQTNVNAVPKKDFNYQPVFNPDSLSVIDTSAQAYHRYISQLPANNMIDNLTAQRIKADWMFGIIIASLLLLTWIKLYYNKYFVQIISSLLNYQLSFKLHRDRNVLYARISGLLNIVFILNLGLFLQITMQYFNINLFHFSGFINYLLYCSLIALFSIIQVIILKVLGAIFFRTKEFNEYIHNIFVSNKGAGIFLLPIILCLPYISDALVKPLIYIGLGVVVVLYFWRFIRGYKIIINKDILKFYLILYFCTLEILPVLLLYKYLQSTVNSGGF